MDLDYSREPTDDEVKEIEGLITNVDTLAKNVRPLNDITGHVPVDEGTKLLDTELRPLSSVKPVTFTKKLDEIPVIWFSMAPAYQLCKIPFSISQEFINSDLGIGARILTYKLQYPIFSGLSDDIDVVEAIDPVHWPALHKFLSQCGFQQGETTYTLECTTMKAFDKAHNSRFMLKVITPSSQTETCNPVTVAGGLIAMQFHKK